MKKSTKIIGVAAAVAVLAGAMVGMYMKFAPETQEGAKAVTIEVIDDKGESEAYRVVTDGVYLVDAMEDAREEGLTFEGTKGQYGLTIDTVNGLTADYTAGNAYWAFYVNDAYCNYGPDQQPVADGDAFRIVYEKWTGES